MLDEKPLLATRFIAAFFFAVSFGFMAFDFRRRLARPRIMLQHVRDLTRKSNGLFDTNVHKAHRRCFEKDLIEFLKPDDKILLQRRQRRQELAKARLALDYL